MPGMLGYDVLKHINNNYDEGYDFQKTKAMFLRIALDSDFIEYKNHGFKDGEVVTYSTDGTLIGGLDTNIRYKIIKLTDDELRKDTNNLNFGFSR